MDAAVAIGATLIAASSQYARGNENNLDPAGVVPGYAVLNLRSYLFDAVYENTIATAEFRKVTDILSGLWDKVRERPNEFLDRRTIENEGLDAATRDFVAGMTDRYAIRLFEQLFIPKPWAIE